MFSTPRGFSLTISLLVVLTLLPACSSQLKMINDTESSYLLELRAEYLEAHPDGEYNEHVRRGEVVKGMDFLAVLASWGHPEKRAKRTDYSETWVYREEDELSKDWIEYSFRFNRSVLAEWEINRHNSQGGILPEGQSEPDDALKKGQYTSGKRVPKEF